MDVKIEQSWKERLAPEFEKDYFKELINFVKQEQSILRDHTSLMLSSIVLLIK